MWFKSYLLNLLIFAYPISLISLGSGLAALLILIPLSHPETTIGKRILALWVMVQAELHRKGYIEYSELPARRPASDSDGVLKTISRHRDMLKGFIIGMSVNIVLMSLILSTIKPLLLLTPWVVLLHYGVRSLSSIGTPKNHHANHYLGYWEFK